MGELQTSFGGQRWTSIWEFCVDVPAYLFGRANKVSRSRRTCSCTYFIIILLLSVRPSSAAQQQWIQFPMIARPGEKYFAATTWPFSHHRLSKLGYIFFFLVSLLSFLLDVVQPCNRYWLVRGRPQLKMFLSKLNGTALEPSHPYSSRLLRPATETINLHNIGPAPDSFQARLLGDITKTKETNSCCIPPCTRRNNDGSKKKNNL